MRDIPYWPMCCAAGAKTPVPISLELTRERRTLLISGPNTGGKTVTLKTVGLLSLMAQAGLPVPAAEAEFPLFGAVLADIGDYQSIQENLSTFSAHVSNIREMALDVTPNSLVLLDELGAATDPEEGGALGVALVEHFRAAGAFTLVSTHLMALKIYGAATEGVVNGSMGFDEETFEPTYQLRVGLPGKSAGLEIATRLGMPEDIMRRARLSMSDRERDVTRFLSELHHRIEETQAARNQPAREDYRTGPAGEGDRSRVGEARDGQDQGIGAAHGRGAGASSKGRRRRPSGGSCRAATGARPIRTHSAESRRRSANCARTSRRTVLSTQDDSRQDRIQPLRVEEGVRVRLKDVREPARVRRVLGNGKFEVEAGFMKMQISIDDVIEVLPEGAGGGKLPKNVSYKPAPELAPVHQEINVIGQRAEEARDAIDEFLDRAVMATASRVRIVHGHGMGVLKRMVAEMLGKHPHVARFYPAPQQEGGAGATIVELRE